MAERLTDKVLLKKLVNGYYGDIDVYQKSYIKLGMLEDIMEKYGIDIQNLDYMLEDYSKNQGRDFAICEERDTLRQERDTWQKACELMGEELDMYATKEDNTISTAQYFYQQAKTEGNDE